MILDRLSKVAIASYDQALVLQPQFYQSWHNRGKALFHLHSYFQATQVAPEDPRGWNNRGTTHLNL